ncbi:MAG: molybdopterin biosynthesis protein MoeB [Clostridia bacterium]|nr:molybdopterin biosynthesis protein MoeB [Clostridia bacterium]
MIQWIEKNGKTVFAGGKNAFDDAARAAENCPFFSEDCEDELVCDDEVSCYNCRYRRWTAENFECMKR